MATFDMRLGPLLGRAHDAHRAVALRELAGSDLDPKGYGALLLLAEEGPMSQRRLGERQGVDRTTMVAVVDALRRGGLLRRTRDRTDRRAYELRVTAAGRQRLEQATTAIMRAEDEFLAGLGTGERDALVTTLRRLVGNHDGRRIEAKPADAA